MRDAQLPGEIDGGYDTKRPHSIAFYYEANDVTWMQIGWDRQPRHNGFVANSMDFSFHYWLLV
jgi:hypothetical protein